MANMSEAAKIASGMSVTAISMMVWVSSGMVPIICLTSTERDDAIWLPLRE